MLKIDDTTHSLDTTCISHLRLNSACGIGCAVEVPEGQTCLFDHDCGVIPDCLSIHGRQGCGLIVGSSLRG